MPVQPSDIGNEQTSTAQILQHGREEFADAVSRHQPMLYRRAHRYVPNPHDAEDAVQDALLSAYSHLHQFKGTAKMTTWLTTIVTNSALTQLRRKPRQPHVSLDEQLNEEQDSRLLDRLADDRPSPEDECIKSEFHGFLMQHVSKLSPPLQQIIHLCHVEGLKMSEAAEVLGVSEAAIKARLWRARNQLKHLISIRRRNFHR